jgi:hypothetical protein
MKIGMAYLFAFLLTTACFSQNLKGNWALEKSVISYQVTHPLHEVIGKSLSAKGKGVCYYGKCRFLVAVPVKSFDSGDNNRDLHMLQITRGADNPLIEVNTQFETETEGKLPKEVMADLEIQFAGKKVKYPKVKLEIASLSSDEAHITGIIPLSLKDFEIKPPTLLGVPIQDLVPVKLEMFWKKVLVAQNKK